MITSDIGFKIENYVGTYHLVDDGGIIRIVSEEFHPARDGEKSLLKKDLFCNDFKTNEFLLIDLTNININNDEEILAFCNKYGLPYSSAKIQDEQPGYYICGLNVSEQQYAQWDPYYRQDTMTRYEFCRHVSTAKRMMQVKHEIESKTKDSKTMLTYLLPLLLYDRVALYKFDEDDPEQHTLTTSFQYYFLNVLHKRKINNAKPIIDLFEFCSEIKCIKNGTNKIVLGEELRKLLNEPYINKLYLFIQYVLRLNSNHLNAIVRDEFFNVTLPTDIEISDELQNIMYEIAPYVLSDSINELMCKVHPQMVITSEGSFHVDWDFKYQFEGFSMELLLMLSSSNMLKKCQNPTCEKFFTPNNGHLDRMYCSHRCGCLVAKRNQRVRDKLNPNRPRLEPGFKSRKRQQKK